MHAAAQGASRLQSAVLQRARRRGRHGLLVVCLFRCLRWQSVQQRVVAKRPTARGEHSACGSVHSARRARACGTYVCACKSAKKPPCAARASAQKKATELPAARHAASSAVACAALPPASTTTRKAASHAGGSCDTAVGGVAASTRTSGFISDNVAAAADATLALQRATRQLRVCRALHCNANTRADARGACGCVARHKEVPRRRG